MLNVGQVFPDFQLKGVVSHEYQNAFIELNQASHPGKWRVVFFWPYDFTFVCPTELMEFGRLHTDFVERHAVILGVSTDSEFVHLAWRQQHPGLQDLPYAMLADVKRELSRAVDVLDVESGVAQRATYIIDPEGVIRFAMVTDGNVGRNPQEVLRVLDALQTNGLCPCNWQKGEENLVVGCALS